MRRDELPASILTPTQRNRLRTPGEDRDTSADYDRATRSRIRKRLTAALVDLDLLAATLEPRDRKQAFSAVGFDSEFPTYSFYVTRALELLFAGVFDPETDKNGLPPNESTIQKLVEDGTAQALLQQGQRVTGVTADISIEYAPDSDAKGGPELNQRSEQELKRMLSYGQISSDDFIDAMESKRSNNR